MTEQALRRAAVAREEGVSRRIEQAVNELAEANARMTVARVARVARVSRQSIYNRPAVVSKIHASGSAAQVRSTHRASEASTAARLRLALDDNKRLRADLSAARAEIARLLGSRPR